MTTIDTPKDTVTERWVCIGQRLLQGGKVRTGWLVEGILDADPMYFNKIKGRPGRTYTVEVIRDPDDPDSVSVRGDPTFVLGIDPDNERAQRWEADERATLIVVEQERAEARDAKTSVVSELCEPLHDLYRKQVGPARRAAFVAMVIEMVTR